MAFKVGRKTSVPFTPGYNEDWNWCVVQSLLRNTVIAQGSLAVHAPKFAKVIGLRELLWQLEGEVVFDTLHRVRSSLGGSIGIDRMKRALIDKSDCADSVNQIGDVLSTIDPLSSLKNSGVGEDLNPIRLQLQTARRLLRASMASDVVGSWWRAFVERKSALASLVEDPSLLSELGNNIELFGLK